MCYRAKSSCKSNDANNVVKVLIENKADVNEKLEKSNFTILHFASQLGKFNTNSVWNHKLKHTFFNADFIDTAELLIKARANVNAADAGK